MPKRKRDWAGASAETAGGSAKQQRIDHKLQLGTRKLAHAFKVAKSFERQKLGRREKTAKTANIDKDVVRIESEIAALKTLDHSASAQQLLHKTLSKIKAVEESDLFAVFLASPAQGLQEIAAKNIHARLCNSKPVKEALSSSLDDILQAAHIDAQKGPAKSKRDAKQPVKVEERAEEPLDDLSEDEESISGQPVQDIDSEDDFADYQDRLASSDDEDEDENDDDDDLDVSKLEQQLRSEGIQGSPSDNSDFGGFEDDQPKVKQKKVKAGSSSKATSSILLPSLTMGGYISASDGSEVEDVDVAPRKNRPGQRARQAIWEKKYGTKAKHLQDTKKGRDQGWDMKRGATGGPRRGVRGPQIEQGHAPPVRKPAKKDDSGPLHPSWEAAKRAKEQKAAQVFTGKKISFD